MTDDSKGMETIDGNCVRCNRRTRHAIRSGTNRTEYLECVKCGNKVDIKAFVYDNLDALSEDDRPGTPKRHGQKGI
jgi:DNA-directed RNA polymerase subunit RPC12/RpoP